MNGRGACSQLILESKKIVGEQAGLDEQLDALYTHIQSVPPSEYTSHTIILLRGFAVSALQSSHNPPKSRRWYGLEEFWQLMQTSSSISPELRGMADTSHFSHTDPTFDDDAAAARAAPPPPPCTATQADGWAFF